MKKQALDRLEKLHCDFCDSENIAVLYAKGLFTLTSKQILEGRVYSVDKLRLLYEQFPTSEELAVLYAKGLVNLSFEQPKEVDIQKNTKHTKKLLSKHPQNAEIQLSYAETLFNLTLKQESETLCQTVAQLREFLLAYPDANQGFQDALDTYLNEHPDHTERYTSLRV